MEYKCYWQATRYTLWWFGLALLLPPKPAGPAGGCTWLLQGHWLPDRWGQARLQGRACCSSQGPAVPEVMLAGISLGRWEWIGKVIWQHGVHLISWLKAIYGFLAAADWRRRIFEYFLFIYFSSVFMSSATELSAFTPWKAMLVLKSPAMSLGSWSLNKVQLAGAVWLMLGWGNLHSC